MPKLRLLPLAFALVLSFAGASALHAATVNVSNDSELRAAITSVTSGDTIAFTADITLAADLPVVQTSVTIDGASHVLDGAGAYRGLFFAAWTPGTATFIPVTATVRDLTIRNCKAKGGNGTGGGGGGAGLGGAIFVAAQANVTLNNVSFSNNTAAGGNGGDSTGYPGGGGGMGGDGGTAVGGGGGLGSGSTGGNNVSAGVGGIATGASGGGTGGNGTAGGANGGGGGGSFSGIGGGSGAGGGVGGANGSAGSSADGGAGGFGGGGGMGRNAGAGGFGGGGGLGLNGGAGGFGGGGGAGGSSGASGGFGGGSGATGAVSGGGGAGMGGAIFVQEGGSLTMAGAGIINGGTVTAGAAGDSGATAGSAFGSGIFAQGDNTITLYPANADDTLFFYNAIADANAGGGSGMLSLVKSGLGTVELHSSNIFAGSITIQGGELYGGTDNALGTGPVEIQSGGILAGTGINTNAVSLRSGGTLGSNDQAMTIGSLDWDGGGIFKVAIGGTPGTNTYHVTGALTKGSSGICQITILDGTVITPYITPGATFTLMTFASQTGFTASDFVVTGISGHISLEANALKFTVEEAPIYGLSLTAAKGRERATFTLTNTGDTTSSFRLTKLVRVTGGGHHHHHGPKPPKPRIELIYLLNGANITNALANGTAAATLAPGATAQVVVKVKTRGPHKRRTIRVTLSATNSADPSVSATAKVSFGLKAER